MPRLSWRKQPNETGLSSFGQAPRGLELRYVGKKIASVSPVTKNRWDVIGWYFTARFEEYGVPLMNTFNQRHWDKQEEAKAACDAYVREHFKAEKLCGHGLKTHA